MKIGFCLYGLLRDTYQGRENVQEKDYKHCWPNIYKNVIEPFTKDHECHIFVSTYDTTEEIKKEMMDLIKPEQVIYSQMEGSTPFTSKINVFKLLENKDLDFIIHCRLDLHFHQPFSTYGIDYDKFNFLFKEKNHWQYLSYSTDNLYMWPHRMTNLVEESLRRTYRVIRPNTHCTHALYIKLSEVIKQEEIHFISDIEERSDVNSFYTICKRELGSKTLNIHPEVIEKFGTFLDV